MTIKNLFEKYSTVVSSETAIEHIFVGEINKYGNAVGFHHESQYAVGISHIVENTRTSNDKKGVYQADVIIKTQPKPGFSSFFPQDWSEEHVMNQINLAYANKKHVTSTLFEGVSSQGIQIRFYLDEDGKIKTAFPVYLEV